MEFCPQRFSWLVSWQDGHSFHSLIFMVDKTFFYFLTSSFFEEEDRVLREWEWMFASNALVNSCKMLDGTQLLVVKKASQNQKNHWKTENVMLSRRTEIWDSGARKRRVLLLCAPQSQSSARCANINFFSSLFYFFFPLTRATEFTRKRGKFS